jgi:hypothetical protein
MTGSIIANIVQGTVSHETVSDEAILEFEKQTDRNEITKILAENDYYKANK